MIDIRTFASPGGADHQFCSAGDHNKDVGARLFVAARYVNADLLGIGARIASPRRQRIPGDIPRHVLANGTVPVPTCR